MSASEAEPLHVLFTMDCVPPDGPKSVPGPSSWERAAGSLAGFAGGLREARLKGTFFLAPDCLPELEQQVGKLREAEMEIGLLCHPQLYGYQSYLGSYSFDRQREILHLAQQSWRNTTGGSAETLRSGFFSANDYTYQIACLEGFRQGSCSLPGRTDPEQCSLWQKARPFSHHTDPLDRKISGTMEFFEVPVSSDFRARGDPQAEMYTPPHLRIEEPCINEHARDVVALHLGEMQQEGESVKCLVFVTHNAVDWGSEEDPHLERLHNLLDLVRREAEDRHMELVPATIGSLHEYADQLWPGGKWLEEQE